MFYRGRVNDAESRGAPRGIDKKTGDKGVWLIKFQLVTDTGSKPWIGAWVTRKDAPVAFVERVLAEEGLPMSERTLWDLDCEERTEKGYTNTYVVTAKSASDGSAPPADAPLITGRDLGDSHKAASGTDRRIARAVAYKAVISSMKDNFGIADLDSDSCDLINELVDVHTEILLGTYVPEKKAETEEEPPTEEDKIFGEEQSSF